MTMPNNLSPEVHAHERDGKTLGVIVGFGPAKRADRIWRYRTSELSLHVYSNGSNLPIALEFCNSEGLPKPGKSTESKDTAAQKLYAFAISLIEQAQINQGEEILKKMLSETSIARLNFDRTAQFQATD